MDAELLVTKLNFTRDASPPNRRIAWRGPILGENTTGRAVCIPGKELAFEFLNNDAMGKDSWMPWPMSEQIARRYAGEIILQLLERLDRMGQVVRSDEIVYGPDSELEISEESE